MRTSNNRHIILDTETTGMNTIGVPYEGHRIIEIGAVEMINRRLTGNNFHIYLNPDRLVDPKAFKIHGISDEFLSDKPRFSDIAANFLEYIHGAELVIHNAAFDISFLNYEFSLLKRDIDKIENFCQITDSLLIARKLFSGKRNNLDALCNRYKINNTKRTLHGALLDAEILAEVFLKMTGGQTSLVFTTENYHEQNEQLDIKTIQRICPVSGLRVINASNEEIIEHEKVLKVIEDKEGNCLWRISKKYR